MEVGAEPEAQAQPLFPFHGWYGLAAPGACLLIDLETRLAREGC